MTALYPISPHRALPWREGPCDQGHLKSKPAEAPASSKGMKRARVLLADDDRRMLAATGILLRADFDVVGMATDGVSLVEAAFQLKPDVIVTDISMPKMNGLEAVRKIRSFLPEIKSIFLTMHDAKGYRKEAQSLRAAYVLKSSAREQLNQVIHTALEDPAQPPV